nr:RidA family protein [Candidatus Gracilibacteria bacterium]
MTKIFSTANNENIKKIIDEDSKKITIFSTSLAPQVLGHYSKSTVAGNFVFCSGQIGIDPDTEELVTGGIEEETRQACRNIRAVLAEHLLGLRNVVKTTIFVSDIKNIDVINTLYKDYFVLKPARTLVEVKSLPKGALIEIEAVAMIK